MDSFPNTLSKILDRVKPKDANTWRERYLNATRQAERLKRGILESNGMLYTIRNERGDEPKRKLALRKSVEDLSPPVEAYATIGENGTLIPLFGSLDLLAYVYYREIPAYRSVVDLICRETTRNGIHIEPWFHSECNRCGNKSMRRVQDPNKPGKCDTCGSTDTKPPDWKQRKILQEWLDKKSWNNSNETIRDIIGNMNYHLQNTDNTYMLLSRRYEYAGTEYIESEIKSVHVPPSPSVRLIANSNGKISYTDTGKMRFVCTKYDHRQRTIVADPRIVPLCPECGTRTKPAAAEIRSKWGTSNTNFVIVAVDEIIIKNGRYQRARPYGYPQILTLRRILDGIHGTDEYFAERMTSRFPPDSWTIIKGDNRDEVRESLDFMAEMRKSDPSYPNVFIASSTMADDAIKVINFNSDIKDLDIERLRTVSRELIHASFGIRPIQARSQEKSTAPLDQAESNKSVQDTQFHLQEAFDEFCLMLGVTDWHFVFNPVERADKIREAHAFGARIDNAIKMTNNLAFGYELGPDDEFVFTQKPVEQMTGLAAPRTGTGASTNADLNTSTPVGEDTKFEGQQEVRRPSDIGGTGDGSVGSGEGTSLDGRGDG